jgi:hypothetical protein
MGSSVQCHTPHSNMSEGGITMPTGCRHGADPQAPLTYTVPMLMFITMMPHALQQPVHTAAAVLTGILYGCKLPTVCAWATLLA